MGLSLCFSLGVTGIIIIIREEKIKSGQAGLLVPKAATTVRESLKAPQACRLPFRHLGREGENVWRA